MANPEVETLFKDILALFIQTLVTEHGDNLRSAIHYGSTIHSPLKRETDLDLLLVFRHLPAGRQARAEVTRLAEAAVESAQAQLRARGFHLEVSPLVKTDGEFRRFNLIYLDMVDKSRILLDRDGLAAAVLRQTAAWIAGNGAKRVQRGLYWYWDLKPGLKPGEIFEIGFP